MPLQCEACYLQLAQAIAKGTAAVCLLDAARKRALAADARAIGVREGSACKGPAER